jgi:hypothetical protein
MDVNESSKATESEDAGVTGGRESTTAPPRAAWLLALGLSVVLGIAFQLTLPARSVRGSAAMMLPAYVWGPAAGVAILLYLWLARARVRVAGSREGETSSPEPTQVVWATLVIAAFATHALTFAPPGFRDLALLSAIHLPALTWLVLGTVVLGPLSDPVERFAAVLKSIEALVTGAIYGGVGSIFALVTFGLFAALHVTLPTQVVQTFSAFLPGLVPVLAVASVYEPGVRPAAQRFGPGLPRLFFIAARLFLPLTFLVLAVVAVVIPGRFAVLAGSRQTLAVFNAMLFAVMLLLVGATPLRPGDLTPRLGSWLRRGMLAVALLATVVGTYALVAILSRATRGGLTANRLTVIGWNVVNLLTLTLLLVRQIRAGRDGWVRALHVAFSAGLVLYGLWTSFVLIALPLIARAAHWSASAWPRAGD